MRGRHPAADDDRFSRFERLLGDARDRILVNTGGRLRVPRDLTAQRGRFRPVGPPGGEDDAPRAISAALSVVTRHPFSASRSRARFREPSAARNPPDSIVACVGVEQLERRAGVRRDRVLVAVVAVLRAQPRSAVKSGSIACAAGERRYRIPQLRVWRARRRGLVVRVENARFGRDAYAATSSACAMVLPCSPPPTINQSSISLNNSDAFRSLQLARGGVSVLASSPRA